MKKLLSYSMSLLLALGMINPFVTVLAEGEDDSSIADTNAENPTEETTMNPELQEITGSEATIYS